ncbi:MAG: hypothetical protein WAN59_13415 [Candidatus Baltobacteraceae bacterium]
MYAQTLLVVMITLTLGTALLTNGLLSTRAAFHGLTSRYLDAAMSESEAQATAQLRAIVRNGGTEGPWPAGAQSLAAGSLCAAASASPGACPFTYQASWQITGSSSPPASPSPGPDLAANLQIGVIDEQRVSAAVTLTMAGRSSLEPVASRTRFLTIRVLRLPPYAIVSGVRDYETVNGLFQAAEGDTGGTPAHPGNTMLGIHDQPAPDPGAPDRYRDTTIQVVAKCHQVLPIADPMSANRSSQNDGLPWGINAEQAYEAPCTAPMGFATQPPGATPVSMDYDASGVKRSEDWSAGNTSQSAEPP